MFNLISKLPTDLLVCCSGGCDSISLAHFLSRRRKYNIQLFHFNHNTAFSAEMQKSVEHFAQDFGLPLIIRKTDKSNLKTEAQFREERIKFLVNGNYNAVVGHTLTDATENFISLNLMQGKTWRIPMKISNPLGGSTIYRPLLITPKERVREYVKRNSLEPYITEDPTNLDGSNMRSWIRAKLMPLLQEKQIGLQRMVLKKYIKYIKESESAA